MRNAPACILGQPLARFLGTAFLFRRDGFVLNRRISEGGVDRIDDGLEEMNQTGKLLLGHLVY